MSFHLVWFRFVSCFRFMSFRFVSFRVLQLPLHAFSRSCRTVFQTCMYLCTVFVQASGGCFHLQTHQSRRNQCGRSNYHRRWWHRTKLLTMPVEERMSGAKSFTVVFVRWNPYMLLIIILPFCCNSQAGRPALGGVPKAPQPSCRIVTPHFH